MVRKSIALFSAAAILFCSLAVPVYGMEAENDGGEAEVRQQMDLTELEPQTEQEEELQEPEEPGDDTAANVPEDAALQANGTVQYEGESPANNATVLDALQLLPDYPYPALALENPGFEADSSTAPITWQAGDFGTRTKRRGLRLRLTRAPIQRVSVPC